MEALPNDNLTALRESVQRLRKNEGIDFARMNKETGINRSIISTFANGGPLNQKYVQTLDEYVRRVDDSLESGDVQMSALAPLYKTELDLYETSGYREGVGWCHYCVKHRKFGALIGNPGTGKTTIIKNFVERTPGTAYIEAWPGMRMGDLLGAIAAAIGATVAGNTYRKTQQIIAALKEREDVTLMIDEAEHLHKWDVDKFEVLRKIWDNTSTPIIICGTQVLHRLLTRENLAQLYRRMFEIRLDGIKADEARAILRDYNVTKEAADALVRIAVDKDHGSMGTFTELLGICLKAAEASGGQIDHAMVADAKKYKMMFRMSY